MVSHIEEHSRKPGEVHERIRRLMGDVTKIELYARRKAEGFDVWGNEVDSDIEFKRRKQIMQLVIAEKPSVAQQIASVIGAEEEERRIHGRKRLYRSWCVGIWWNQHSRMPILMCGKSGRNQSLPMIPENWQHEVKRDTAAQYKVLRELMHDTRVDSVVCATDAGREGELIFRLVYEMGRLQ